MDSKRLKKLLDRRDSVFGDPSAEDEIRSRVEKNLLDESPTVVEKKDERPPEFKVTAPIKTKKQKQEKPAPGAGDSTAGNNGHRPQQLQVRLTEKEDKEIERIYLQARIEGKRSLRENGITALARRALGSHRFAEVPLRLQGGSILRTVYLRPEDFEIIESVYLARRQKGFRKKDENSASGIVREAIIGVCGIEGIEQPE